MFLGAGRACRCIKAKRLEHGPRGRNERDLAVDIVFFVCLVLVAYVYILYPLVVFTLASIAQTKGDFKYVLSRGERRASRGTSSPLPSVSIVIAVFNEENVIEDRIANCLTVDYPRDKLEITIVSDGSSDRTNEIVSGYANQGVKLIALPTRNGKAFALNRAIPETSGEILLLTDSNTTYDQGAVRKLVRHFDDTGIGGVCGELRVRPFDQDTAEESAYWKFENFLKFMESRLNMTLGANGGIYAIRRGAFRPIPDGTIVDDFVVFLNVRKAGFKTLFDPEAIAYERSAPSLRDEYQRKTRIGSGDLQSLRLAAGFLSPNAGPVSFAFWSHKVLRWSVPFLLIGLFVSNLALARESALFLAILVLQCVFYASSIAGAFLTGCVLFKAPYYFVSMNMALLHGFVRYAVGAQKGTWERTERESRRR